MTITTWVRRAMAPYVLVLAVAGFLLYRAGQIEYYGPPGRIGPDFWPKIVLGVLISVCVFEIVKIALLGRSRQVAGLFGPMATTAPSAGGRMPVDESPSYPLRLVTAIVATVLYAALVPKLGFFLATLPYLIAFIHLGGYNRLKVSIPVSLIGTLVMLFFFSRVAYVSLPIGQEPFSAVTLLLLRLMGVR